MENARARLGLNIRKLRLSADMTQEEAAARAGTERPYWSEIERGNKNPTIDVIGRIAEALSVDISALFQPLPSDERKGGGAKPSRPRSASSDASE